MTRTSFKTSWNIHKWTGITCALVFTMIATTGFLLLIKKRAAWIQPPTMRGTDGAPTDWLPMPAILDNVYALDDPAFSSLDDIDRIDTRVGRNLHKIRSEHGDMEVQVDAISGAILSGPVPRRSDFIERLHDGSFFGDFAHDWVMPLIALGLLGLVVTGLWIWIEPILNRRKRRRARANANATQSS